jgi:hypothetical protein
VFTFLFSRISIEDDYNSGKEGSEAAGAGSVLLNLCMEIEYILVEFHEVYIS